MMIVLNKITNYKILIEIINPRSGIRVKEIRNR